MSLKPEPIGPIPQETVRVAKAAFPQGNLFMKMRDEIGVLYQLELDDSGFHYSALCEFRRRLIEGQLEQLLFEKMLSYLKQQGLIKAGGRQQTDTTHVLAAVRVINRVVCVGGNYACCTG